MLCNRVYSAVAGRREQSLVFFFNDTATTEIYTLSLHDALPICGLLPSRAARQEPRRLREPHQALLDRIPRGLLPAPPDRPDRKSTRLNSSHSQISYAVFCLKKKINHLYTLTIISP